MEKSRAVVGPSGSRDHCCDVTCRVYVTMVTVQKPLASTPFRQHPSCFLPPSAPLRIPLPLRAFHTPSALVEMAKAAARQSRFFVPPGYRRADRVVLVRRDNHQDRDSQGKHTNQEG